MIKSFGNKIEKILGIDLDNFSIKLKFEDGVSGTIYLTHIFKNPKGLAAEVLKGGMFNDCFVSYGALAWPNGLELCPDMLKELLEEKTLKNKKAA